MNILLIAQNYHPCVGGVETHARQVAQALRTKHSIQVVAGNFASCQLPSQLGTLHTNLLAPAYASHWDGNVQIHAFTPTWAERIRMLPIAVRTIPKLRRYAYNALYEFGYPWYRRVYFPRLLQLMQGMDVVHSLAGGYLGWTAQAAAQELGIPFVCTPFVHPHQWGDEPASVAYYQRSQAVIGLVESDRQYLESLGVPAENLHTVGVSPDLPPTSDPQQFRQQHGLVDVPLIVYAGRMMPQKGAKALLDSTALVWQTLPEAHFVFIGPSTAESTLWFQQPDPRVLYLGKVSHQEKANALAACDVFCMPSVSEILPTVYLEAWSYGKPVIGGLAEGLPALVAGNQAGITVSQAPEQVAEAVIKLLQNPDLRAQFGSAGQALVTQNYTVEAVVSSLETLYSQLIPTHAAMAEAK